MAANKISIEQFLSREEPVALFDVRTPAEYVQGHIPGAVNLPLFSNEERAEVGTTYKQVDPYKAFLQGLDFVGPKMRFFVEEARRLAPEGRVAVHCWRGGQRSSSMGWLLSLAGMEVEVLVGGYKAYRNYILEQFSVRPANFLVVGGETGSGKTEVLHALQELGEQVIDLEGLAHHKGSAFGALGEASQPSVEQFENALYQAFHHCDPGRPIWLENESKPIGRVFIPDGLWRRILDAPLLALQVPFERRVQRLVQVYARYPKGQLADSFEKIAKRLGGQHLKAALEALEDDDPAEAARIGLRYYDKAYNHHTLSKRDHSKIFYLPTENLDPAKTARELIAFAEKNNLCSKFQPIN